MPPCGVCMWVLCVAPEPTRGKHSADSSAINSRMCNQMTTKPNGSQIDRLFDHLIIVHCTSSTASFLNMLTCSRRISTMVACESFHGSPPNFSLTKSPVSKPTPGRIPSPRRHRLMVLLVQEIIFSYHPSSCRAAVKRS